MRTNRFYALLLAMVLCCVATAEAKVISFGPTASYMKASYTLSDSAGEVENKGGYQAGINAAITLPLVSITSGFIYSNSSFNIGGGSLTDGITCEVRAQNFTVPVIVGLSILGPLTIEGGPVFLIKEMNKMTATTTLIGQSVSYEVKDFSLRKFDSYVVGLRAKLAGINIYARYNFQFGKLESDEFGDVGYRSFIVGAGFMF